jgi:putative transposase
MPDWPHAPVHRLDRAGMYIVTAGTYAKHHLLHDRPRLDLVHDLLLETLAHYGWQLQAWAVLANHYHFVALSPEQAGSLRPFLTDLHHQTAVALNALDGTPGRRVWFQYRDTHITFQRSYLARLRYVNENAVKHGVAKAAEEYPWCSAAWFERAASPGFRRTVRSFKIDGVRVEDDF